LGLFVECVETQKRKGADMTKREKKKENVPAKGRGRVFPQIGKKNKDAAEKGKGKKGGGPSSGLRTKENVPGKDKKRSWYVHLEVNGVNGDSSREETNPLSEGKGINLGRKHKKRKRI